MQSPVSGSVGGVGSALGEQLIESPQPPAPCRVWNVGSGGPLHPIRSSRGVRSNDGLLHCRIREYEIERILCELAQSLQIAIHDPAVPLDDVAGDHDRVDVARVRAEDDGANRI